MSASLTGVSIRVMTYDDIASETGLKPASARQLVRRNGWRRVPGNDGRTRIEVPVDKFESHLKGSVEATVGPEELDAGTASESPLEAPFITALSSHIERLERALRDAEANLSDMAVQRDEARSSATAAREEVWMARGQIDVLRAQIEAERARTAAADRRAEEVAAERDRWHAAFTARRPWWRRLAG
jgi:hypothetical protein